jgi:hypothetical protein
MSVSRRSRLLYGAQAVADTVGGVVLAMLATVTVMQFFNPAFWPGGIVTDIVPEKLVSDP